MKHRRTEVGVISILVAILLLPGLLWGLPSAITPQVDSPLPLGSLLIVAEWRAVNSNITYPAFHQLLQLPFYGVAAAAFWLTGQVGKLTTAWPFGFRDPSLFLSVLTLLSNLCSFVMAVLIVGLSKRIATVDVRWYGIAALLTATNGVFAYYGRVGNLDLPYAFWWVVATVALWQYFDNERPVRALVSAAIAAAFSVASKDQGAGLVLGGALLVFALGSPGNPGTHWRTRASHTVIFGAVLVGTYAVVAIVANPVRWWNHFVFVINPHSRTEVPQTLLGQLTMLQKFAAEFLGVFGFPVLVLAAIGAFSLWRRERAKFWLLVLPVITYYVLVIAVTRVVYPRFMIPLMFPVMVMTAYGFAWAAALLQTTHVGGGRWVSMMGVALVLWSFFMSYLPVTYAMTRDLKRDVAEQLPQFVQPSAPLLIARMQAHNFPNRDVYERYAMMMVPGDVILPGSRVTSSVLAPIDFTVEYYLLGTGTAGLPTNVPFRSPPLGGELIMSWRYPEWVRRRVIVPVVYEFELYRRTAPVPMDYCVPDKSMDDLSAAPRTAKQRSATSTCESGPAP